MYAERVTQEVFARYGHLISPEQAEEKFLINNGATMRHHNIAPVECFDAPPILSIFEAVQIPHNPYEITLVEFHPLGSQAFIPLDGQQLIVVVGEKGDYREESLACYRLDGMGASFAPGTWHATLIAPEGGKFLVVDRANPGSNCVVHNLQEPIMISW
jgi:ureidoglycolate lyase